MTFVVCDWISSAREEVRGMSCYVPRMPDRQISYRLSKYGRRSNLAGLLYYVA